MGIFAAQDIDSGVELTYDYMFQHAGTAALAGAYRCVQLQYTLFFLVVLSQHKSRSWPLVALY